MVNLDMSSGKIQPQRRLPVYRRIVSLDLEATGFFGEPMAAAASYQEVVPLDDGYWTGSESGFWFRRIDYRVAASNYVTENIVPVLEKPYDNIPVPDPISLAEVIEQWRVQYETLSSIGFTVITHVPFPIETEFLGNAYRHGSSFPPVHPFPVIDLCSMLLQSGYRGDPSNLEQWWRMQYHKLPSWYVPHHPLADARLAGAVYWHLVGAKTRPLDEAVSADT